MKSLSRSTPSKINAILSVTGKRPDGYHTLETLFLPLPTPADHITLTEAEKLSIVTQADIPLDRRNLCWKAIELFCERVPQSHPNWQILIDKRIPIAGGMAGGSTDAAAVLLMMNEAFDSPLDFKALSFLAVKLGADVPFFLNPVPSIGSGIGDRLIPITGIKPHFEIPLVWVASDFPVSAAWAYAHRNGPFSPEGRIQKLIRALQQGDLNAFAQNIRNDLSPAVFHKFPLLRIIRTALMDRGALTVELSGSGPTLFAVSPTSSHAESLADSLRQQGLRAEAVIWK